MILNKSKENALIQLINCKEKWTVKSIRDLSDGKLFCGIVEEVFPETFELLKKEGQIVVNYEELTVGEELSSSLDLDLRNGNRVGKETESENSVIKNSEAVQKPDAESMRHAVHESESVLPAAPVELTPDQVNFSTQNEDSIMPTLSAVSDTASVSEQVKSRALDEETVTPIKSVVSDDTSVLEQVNFAVQDEDTIISIKSVNDTAPIFEPVEFAMENSVFFTESEKPSEKDKMLTSNRYRLIQYFIDVRYNLKSDTVINFSECWMQNELELAKVLIFILSEVVRHYVRSNDPFIQTLSLVDTVVQQDLEQCFNFLINERNKITKEEIEKLLNSCAPYKSESSPDNLYSCTPRRCASKYKRFTQKSTDSVFSNSPLKSFFESPVFTKADIDSKENEIKKLRKIIYQEESQSSNLLNQIQGMKEKLKDKEREIKDLKIRNRVLQEREHPEDCKHCVGYQKVIEEQKRHIEELTECNDKTRTNFEDSLLNYQVEVAEHMVELKFRIKESEEKIRAEIEIKERVLLEKIELEETNKKLSEQLKEKIKELEIYKEKLTDAMSKIEEETEPSVLGESMGGYFKENGNPSLDMSRIKSAVPPQVKNVSVQCSEEEFHIEKGIQQSPKSPLDCGSSKRKRGRPRREHSIKSNDSPEIDTQSEQLVYSPSKEAISTDVSRQSIADQKDLLKHMQPSPDYVLSSHNCSKISDESAKKENPVFAVVSPENDTQSKQFAYTSPKKASAADVDYQSVVKDNIGSLWRQYDNTLSKNENLKNNLSLKTDGSDTVWQNNNNFIPEIKNANSISYADNGLNKALSILQKIEQDLDEMSTHFSATSKVLSGPNGSNGRFGSHVIKGFLEELKKSIQNSVLCLSEAESQIKLQNNNLISKKSINDTGDNFSAVVFPKCLECLKAKNDISTGTIVTTLNQESFALREKTEELESLKNEYTMTFKTLTLKKKELENYRKKYYHLKTAYQESHKRAKEIELKCQKLQNNLKEVLEREENSKREYSRTKFVLKQHIKEMSEKIKHYENAAGTYDLKMKSMREENICLQNRISVLLKNNEELFSHIEYLKKNHDTKSCINELPGTSSENKDGRHFEGIVVEFAYVGNTSNVVNKVSPDSNNESVISCALSCKSSVFSNLNCDDEDVLHNVSSIEAIKSGHESVSHQDFDRMQELCRRNTLVPSHLQSHYAIEALPTTPIEKNLSKCYKGGQLKAIEHKKLPENNVHVGKKRKVSEMETDESVQLSTPVVKTKRTFLQKVTPQSLTKLLRYRRSRRPSLIIKPKS